MGSRSSNSGTGHQDALLLEHGATVNSSEMMTALASIMPTTFMVSSAQTARSVRGSGLVQHRQAGAAHPQRLRRRGDLHGSTDEDADGVAGADARGRQTAGDAPGTFMDLAPRVADGFVRLSRDHALVLLRAL